MYCVVIVFNLSSSWNYKNTDSIINDGNQSSCMDAKAVAEHGWQQIAHLHTSWEHACIFERGLPLTYILWTCLSGWTRMSNLFKLFFLTNRNPYA